MHFPFSDNEIVAALPPQILKEHSCIAIINSFAEGFANSTSDFDVMVVTDTVSSPTGRREMWIQCSLSGRRLDVYNISSSLITERMHEAEVNSLDIDLINFAHKIRRAKIISGEITPVAIYAKFDWRKFDQKICDFHMARTGQYIEDICGNVSECDWLGAVINSRRLVANGLDAYVALLGESQPREKWKSKKLRRALGDKSPIIAKYADIEFGANLFINENPTSWIDMALSFFRAIQSSIYFENLRQVPLISFDGNIADCPAFSTVIKTDGRFYFHNPRPMFEISEQSALLWFLSLGAKSYSHLADAFNRYGGAQQTLSESEIRDRCELLRKSGCLRLRLD
jgi:hypothetical protein